MADAVTPITTHATDAKARLLQQFKEKTRIEALLDAINVEIQRYENEVMDLSDVLDIDAMGGVNLDHIGNIVGQKRAGRTDADYRVAIRQKIAANVSSGTPDQLVEIFANITGSTTTDFLEDYPAGFGIYGDSDPYPDGTFEAVEAAKPAGVYMCLFERLTKEGSSDLITTEAGDAIYLRTPSTGR
jgi:hypothetical protein